MLFDTHLHLIYRNRLNYPWLNDVPALNRDATYEDYERTARRIGIVGAMHMEVDVAEDDIGKETDMIGELMARPHSLMRGAISSCRPEADGFETFLERQRVRPEIRGFRRVLHVVPDEISRTRLFRSNVKCLSGTGWTFDLCVLPAQIPLAIELVEHCPDVGFILDHCGVPDIRGGGYDSWSVQIRDLSRRDNVMAKISGVMAYADPSNWTLADLRPYVEHTIDCFGWDRVIWGSDSPVCTLGGHLETWVAATHALIADCSESEKDRLLYRNAINLWSLDT